MITFDKNTNKISLMQSFDLDDALWLIEKAKEHMKDVLDSGTETEDVAKRIQSFLDWDPKTEATPCYEGTKEDMMQHIADEMSNDEWNEYFDPNSAFRNALADWLSDEFDYEMTAEEVSPDLA